MMYSMPAPPRKLNPLNEILGYSCRLQKKKIYAQMVNSVASKLIQGERRERGKGWEREGPAPFRKFLDLPCINVAE